MATIAGLEEAMSRANAESITIPFGVGICGNVAETKETINIKDAYEVMSRILLLTRLADRGDHSV